jgi:hypothetical protein
MLITETFGKQEITYDPEKQVVVRDPNNPDRVIVIPKVPNTPIDEPGKFGGKS